MNKPIFNQEENNIDPEIEHLQLDEIRRRKLEVASGKISLVDGKEVLKRMRALIRK
jgi:hypothetical protein